MAFLDSVFLSLQNAPGLAVLLGLSLKATAVLVAALLLDRLLRRSTASARHLVWGLAFAGLLALPLLGPVTPRWEVAVLPTVPEITVPERTEARVAPVVSSPSTFVARSTGTRSVPVVRSAPRPVVKDAGSFGGGYSVTHVEAKTPAASALTDRLREVHWLTWVLVVWAVGALGFLVHYAGASCRLWLVARRATRVLDPDWLAETRVARRKLHLTRHVRLIRSRDTSVPMTWGVFRPVIVLPAAADGWATSLRRDVLLHELAHIKRNDYFVQLLVRITCTLYWFHPLVWLGAARLRMERERACDDRVLGAGSTASQYATHLLQVARGLRPSRAARASVAMTRGSNFSGRLASVLDANRPRGSLSRWATLPTYVFAAAVLVPLAALSPGPTASAEECSGESAVDAPVQVPPPTRVVNASFVSGDIAGWYSEEASFRVPNAIGRQTLVLSAAQEWCPVRFADPVTAPLPAVRAKVATLFFRLQGAGRLSTELVQKRPAPEFPRSYLACRGRCPTKPSPS